MGRSARECACAPTQLSKRDACSTPWPKPVSQPDYVRPHLFLLASSRGQAGAAGGKRRAERRVWVRYPANLQTTVQLAGHPVVETRVSARVQDISPGGANLLVDQAFESGQMLSVELPHTGEQETHTVLACIVRVVADGVGQWSLGCVFSRELTDEDREGFGAKRVRHAPPDQRLWMRFATNREAIFQKVRRSQRSLFGAGHPTPIRQRRRPGGHESRRCRSAPKRRSARSGRPGRPHDPRLCRACRHPTRRPLGAGLQFHSRVKRRGVSGSTI